MRSLDKYHAVVLGAPLYMFHWHKDALNFLSRHRAALAQKPAAILKRELEADADWCRFTQLATQSQPRVQQTPLAAWAPPHQKTPARYLNVEVLVVFASSFASLRTARNDTGATN